MSLAASLRYRVEGVKKGFFCVDLGSRYFMNLGFCSEASSRLANNGSSDNSTIKSVYSVALLR